MATPRINPNSPHPPGYSSLWRSRCSHKRIRQTDYDAFSCPDCGRVFTPQSPIHQSGFYISPEGLMRQLEIMAKDIEELKNTIPLLVELVKDNVQT